MHVLLLEFAGIQRFHRGFQLPFLKGLLLDHHVNVQWFRFCVDLPHDDASICLDPSDASRLTTLLANASHIISNRALAPSMVKFLRQAQPDLQIGHIDHTPHRDVPDPSNPLDTSQPLAFDASCVLEFLDLPTNENLPTNLILQTPDFGWKPANQTALSEPPLPYLLCNSSQSKAIDLFQKQLVALLSTHRLWVGRLAVRAIGESILENIESIANIMVREAKQPIELLIDGRADHIVSARTALRQALRCLEESPHTLHLGLLGIDSFCNEELALLDKTTSFENNFEWINSLFELETDFPTSFEFHHDGLGLLLFTPWTRAENLALNLAILRRCNLANRYDKLLASRLRWFDPRFDTACPNRHDHDVPWRFAEPVMKEVCRILIRLSDDDVGADSMGERLTALGVQHSDFTSKIELAEGIVDEAMARPNATAKELIESVETASITRKKVQIHVVEPDILNRLLLFVTKGHKPVARVEGNDLLSRGWDEAALQAMVPVVRARRPVLGGPVEYFLGKEEALVMRAIELTDQIESIAQGDRWREAVEKVGTLLGYPRCCSRAFADRASPTQASYTWFHVQARIRHLGPVSEWLNPSLESLVNHVPCSLDCEASIAMAARTLALLHDESPDYARRIEQACRNPWLLFIDHDGVAIELCTDGKPQGRFSYRPGIHKGNTPLLGRVLEGDELEVGDQNLVVLRRGQRVASLGGRAFLWWHQAPVQQAFWQRMITLRFRSPKIRTADETNAPGSEAHRLAIQLSHMLMAHPDFFGFRVRSIHPERHDYARIILEHAGTTMVVVAAPRVTNEAAFVHAGPLSLFHPHDQNLDTRQKHLIIRKLAAFLKRQYQRREPQ